MTTGVSAGIRQSLLVTKTINIVGNGATKLNLFSLTGSVKIKKLYGIITAITDITVCTTTSFDMNDTLNTVPLTSAAGTAISGFSIGSIVMKKALAATAISATNASQIRLNDVTTAGNDVESGAWITAWTAAPANYIRFAFTGDALTNFIMKFYCEYEPLSDNGLVTAI